MILAAGAVSFLLFHAAGAQKIAGVILGCTSLAALYGLCLMVFWKTGITNILHWMSRKEMLFCFAVFLFINLFFYAEMTRQETIYYWDDADYWRKAIDAGNQLFSSPGSLLKKVYFSINHEDYNCLIPFFLALPTKVMGPAHITHVLLNLNLFLLPAAMVVALTAKNSTAPKAPLALLFAVAAAFPILLYPVLAGYLDVFAVLMASLLYCLLFSQKEALFHFDAARSLMLTAILILMVFGRRYFGYVLFGAVAASLLYVGVCLLEKHTDRYGIAAFGKMILLTGGSTAAVLLLFFRGFLRRSLCNSFQKQYKAYQLGNMGYNWKKFFLYIGILILALCIMDVVLDCVNRRFAYPTAMLAAMFLPAFFFFQVQSMGPHHYYIEVVPLLLLQMELLGTVQNWKTVGRRLVTTLIAVVVVLNFTVSYVPMLHSYNTHFLTGSQRFLPLYREDVQELRSLADQVNSLTKGSKAHSYMLSASFRLNYSLLQNVYAPKTFCAVPSLYSTSEVDLRDGFPYAFLKSNVVIVCSPVQVGTAEKDAQIVALIAKDILQKSPISENYERKGEYALMEGVKAYVYYRRVNFTQKQLQYLQEQFNHLYPQWKLDLSTAAQQ